MEHFTWDKQTYHGGVFRLGRAGRVRAGIGLGVAVRVGVELMLTLSRTGVFEACGGEVAVGLYTPNESKVDEGSGTGVLVATLFRLASDRSVGTGVRV